MSITGQEIIAGDALAVLRTLEAGSVQCVVTSPPYYALRDYGTAKWEGGDAGCDHKQGRNGSGRADGIVDERGQRNRDGVGSMGGDCGKCGARRIDSQIGLESTPEAYVAALVGVFREVRRVLRDDGVVFLNLGDSYMGSGERHTGRNDADRETPGGRGGSFRGGTRQAIVNGTSGLKPKDLIGIPWRVAFALQADGWWLRSEIIWHKPNPMPESVGDRPTKAHEQVFLLAKSQRYYYDAEAIKEPSTSAGEARGGGIKVSSTNAYLPAGSNKQNLDVYGTTPDTRNKRSVWTIATQPYAEAHFATFPEKLVEPCVLAGCPVGGVVLDPFCGSGTVLAVAKRLGRGGIGIELNPEYIDLAWRRVSAVQPPLDNLLDNLLD